MTKRYRVTQYSDWRGYLYAKDYRWRWVARLSAFMHRGTSASGLHMLSTTLTTLDDGRDVR